MTFQERYLAAEPALMQFYAAPASMDAFSRLSEIRGRHSVDRERLCQAIRRQCGNQLHPAAEQNLRLLASHDSFTITTGQQIGLMGGPLYAVYKTITTIRLAAEASGRLGVPVIPVFWMASEDHDVEEVNHFYTDYGRPWTYASPVTGPVGRHIFTDEIHELMARSGRSAFGRWFKPGIRWSDAFRACWMDLFGKYGLLVLDPDDPELKTSIRPVIQADLLNNAGLAGVTDATERLEAIGLSGQVLARDPNFFLIENGQRKKVLRRSDQLYIGMEQQPISMQSLLTRLEKQPEAFSPNVVLRPLYQESILPNLAYVGGWAEVAYWGQFKPVFERSGIPMPMVWPRMSVSLASQEIAGSLSALGFSVPDLSRPLHQLKYQLAERLFHAAAFHDQLEDILNRLGVLGDELDHEHPTLKRSMEGWKTRTTHFFEHLQRRRLKLLMNQQPEVFRQLEQIKQSTSPDGVVQERIWSLAAVHPVDPSALVDLLMQSAKALSPEHQWILM